MNYAFLHGICEEVAIFDFNLAVFILVVLFWGWRVLLVDIAGHMVLLIMGDCLGRSEVLLVATELGIAVFDESALAGIEDGALVIGAISCVVTGLSSVYFLCDVRHFLLEVPFVGSNVDLVIFSCFYLIGEEISWFS